MSLEGLHLYRLINHAFKPPKSIFSYYLVGWLLPCVPIGLYCMVRQVKQHSGCWVENAGHLEWIMYGPNLLCVSLNVIFLAIILKVLLTQLQAHPNEPSNYRRALKATCILVPLFGLQFFLYVYRPFQEGSGYIFYEIFAKIVTNSQGATVAIVFCFFNSEVHTQFRSHLLRSRSRSWHQDARSYTFSTEGRRVSAKGSTNRLECIPLTAYKGGPSPNRDFTSGLTVQAKDWRVNMRKNGTSGATMI
ncbi:hypothetical protein RRG08_022448 [Elysia crispata]|uniref:G-protein coupled receptors family 2 profile 2 domain-containing protein n=1 Tax=Elysia crispata TaxID=231223 RepID=A0AAE1D8D3_9GAST|nr:hypothetical protein RRG08_022448 [Elysia crispata]